MNPFTNLQKFSRKPRNVTIYYGHETQDDEDTPAKLEVEDSLDVVLFELSQDEAKRIRGIMDRLPDPPIQYEPVKIGGKMVQRKTGYDFTDLKYLRAQTEAQEQQNALAVLLGVEGMLDATPGENEAQKIATLQKELGANTISVIADAIFGRVPKVEDSADFNSRSGSPDSRRSGDSSKTKSGTKKLSPAAKKPSDAA